MYLFLQLTKRYITQRYRGTLLGLLWPLLNPLLMLVIFTFVFSIVFQARWNTEIESRSGFSLMLFGGLILHAFFLEALRSASTIMIENANFVKKVVFPLGVLVPASVTANLFQLLIGLAIYLVAILILWPQTHLTCLYIPLLILPFYVMTLGLGWFAAALGVYIRDLPHIIGMVGTLLLFFSTILYPAERLPESIRPFIYLNPLSFVTDTLRGLALTGTLPSLEASLLFVAVSSVIAVGGYSFFRLTKRGFADVL